nr:alpha-dioxygenase 1-like [Tanacetum cinerariifolium]
MAIQIRGGRNGTQGRNIRLAECLVGDETGVVVFTSKNEQEINMIHQNALSCGESDLEVTVTDIVTSYGGCNAIIVSASQDRTCKVWNLARGTMLRNIVFPIVIDAVALDHSKHVFFMDGSAIYGSNSSHLHQVRTYKEGKLKIENDGLIHHDENRLPITGLMHNGWIGVSTLQALFILEHNVVCDTMKTIGNVLLQTNVGT